MYDRPENRAAHDALWSLIRSELGYGPETLTRDLPPDATWAHPDLVLGQICNLPYRARHRETLVRIANADYGLPDTPPGYYHAVFIVQKKDAARGLGPACLGTFAYNDPLSHSGWGAPLATITAKGLAFRDTLATGSHINSARAVAEGRADLASIDAVTWRMLSQWEPWTQDLEVIGRTSLSPGMTFVTTQAHDADAIHGAIARAISAQRPDHAEVLGLKGLVQLPDRAYDLPLPPAPPR
ncbi:MAG: PhnD/SsuA/transferrin family substrate-binding protein [Pseudomonadota bacterium]